MTKEINFEVITNELKYNGTIEADDVSDEIKLKYNGTILDKEVVEQYMSWRDANNKTIIHSIVESINEPELKDNHFLTNLLNYTKTNKISCNLNAEDSHGYVPLYTAIHTNNIVAANILLYFGADLDYTNYLGNTIFHQGAINKQGEFIYKIMQYVDGFQKQGMNISYNLNIQSKSGLTPIHIAVFNRDLDLISSIVKKSDLSLVTQKGYGVLEIAAISKNYDLMDPLMKYNATVSRDARQDKTIFHIVLEDFALTKEQKLEYLKLLAKNGRSVDKAEPNNGFKIIHDAVLTQSPEIVKLFVDQANVNAAAYGNITPLHLAAKAGLDDVAQVLIENGARIGAKTFNGYTSMHYAAFSGNKKLMEMLVAKDYSKSLIHEKDYVLGLTAKDYADWRLKIDSQSNSPYLEKIQELYPFFKDNNITSDRENDDYFNNTEVFNDTYPKLIDLANQTNPNPVHKQAPKALEQKFLLEMKNWGKLLTEFAALDQKEPSELKNAEAKIAFFAKDVSTSSILLIQECLEQHSIALIANLDPELPEFCTCIATTIITEKRQL
jgi:ankyrin repeat protein